MLGKAKQTLLEHLLLVQTATILLSVILSALVFFPLGTITSNIGGQCLLFSKFYLIVSDFSLNNPAKFNLTGTEFGPPEECDFTTFLNVTVTIAGLIFLWFLIHLGRVSELERSEPGFLVSVFLFYLVLFICVLVSSIKISSGFSYWCDNIHVCVGSDDSSSDCRKLPCDQFSHVTLEDIPEDTSRFYAYFLTAQISSWLLAATLLFECFITSQRIYQTVSAEFIEEAASSTLDATIVSPDSVKTGIINLASDEIEENQEAVDLKRSPEVAKRTLAEVTVHADNVTSSIEMAAVATSPDVQIMTENEDKSSQKKQSELLQGEDDNSRPIPMSRKRKTRKITQ
ncbi:hypothetical protein BsWGS_10069 [Bradybaena similaris]